MIRKRFGWFQRNAYGQFLWRVLVALGAAAISVVLSFLPYETALQAIWVIISSLFMGSLALKQRLNESDDVRYRRLFRQRIAFLQANDPEALTTILSDNLRPRVFGWLQDETGIDAKAVPNIDALDSLARNGDDPGQLIFRAGMQFGRWLPSVDGDERSPEHLQQRIAEFVQENEGLLGTEVCDGVYLRHIAPGEQRPVGVHLFHSKSRLLLSVEYYDAAKTRHSISLSAIADDFQEFNEDQWMAFRDHVHDAFPAFRPAQGGSGPQKQTVPFFISAIVDTPVPSDDELKSRLKQLQRHLPKQEESTDTDV